MTKRLPIQRRNGERVAVIRPSNPAVALQLAGVAQREQDSALLRELPRHVEEAGGHYTFAGFLAVDKRGRPFVVDENGKVVEAVKPGDSLVGERGLEKRDEAVNEP